MFEMLYTLMSIIMKMDMCIMGGFRRGGSSPPFLFIMLMLSLNLLYVSTKADLLISETTLYQLAKINTYCSVPGEYL